MRSLSIVVVVAVLGLVAFIGLRGREAAASPDVRVARSPAPAPAARLEPRVELSGPDGRAEREVAPGAGETPAPEPPPPLVHAYLPADLEPLSTMIPERLALFDAATPAERFQQARELLAHSIAVIQCATGQGPIGQGMLGDGDASFTGQGGKWSFQVNTSTFHFYDYEYPEYPEYIALLRTAYDEQMVPLDVVIELPEDLAQRIRQRAQEALGWL